MAAPAAAESARTPPAERSDPPSSRRPPVRCQGSCSPDGRRWTFLENRNVAPNGSESAELASPLSSTCAEQQSLITFAFLQALKERNWFTNDGCEPCCQRAILGLHGDDALQVWLVVQMPERPPNPIYLTILPSFRRKCKGGKEKLAWALCHITDLMVATKPHYQLQQMRFKEVPY